MTSIKFKYEGASAILEHLSPDLYLLRNVWSQHRGRGHAHGVLQQVIDFADQNGYDIFLVAQPYGHPIPTAKTRSELVTFYKKFGFVRDTRHGGQVYAMIRRQPSREKQGI